MNILLVNPFSLSDVGGLTTFVTRLQEGVNDSRSHTAVLLVPGESDLVTKVTVGNSDVRGISLRSVYVPRAVLKGFVAFWLYLPVTLYALWTFLRRERVDVVNLHFPIPELLYFCALRPFSPWKLVVTLHGSDMYLLPNRTSVFRALVRVLLSRADYVVAGTAHLIATMRAQYPGLRARTRVIPNGIPLVESGPRRLSAPPAGLPDSYILSVGNLIRRKGHDVLLRALAIAAERGCRLNLVVVGQGPEAASLAALARELNIEDCVVFKGEVAHGAVAAFYAGAKFFVHAAREEAQGLVLVEAMSCRKAVVATRVLGIPEVVRHGDTGLLVEPGDAESLASALITLECDDALREALAERAYAYVTQEHTWERFIARYLDVYEEVAWGISDEDAAPTAHPAAVTQKPE